MGDVISFDNVRVAWDRVVLRATGIASPLSWTVVKDPANGWRARGVQALPHIVLRTDSQLRVLSLRSGVAPARLEPLDSMTVLLDLLVVQHCLASTSFESSDAWVLFDDGSHIELKIKNPDYAGELWNHAKAVMRRADIQQMTSSKLASVLCLTKSAIPRTALQ